MGFERVNLFGIIEFDYSAIAGAACLFSTDQPGNALALRETLAIPAAAGRRTVKLRLKSTTKGKQYRVRVTSAGRVILYGGRVFARPLGLDAEWAWYALPIAPTANTWTEFALPIEKTGVTFTPYKIPLVGTPELFEWVSVPVAK